MANRRIDWDQQALRQFNKAILYIAEESVQNAENIRADVVEKLKPCSLILKDIHSTSIKLRTMVTTAPSSFIS
jgi:hypothetical protein